MTEISKEYAAALFALAREQGREREFSEALRLLSSALTAAPEYAEILASPGIPLRERQALLEQAFGGRVPEYVLSFVQLLCEKGRIRELGDCAREYETLYQALSAVSPARIVSAAELTGQEKEALVQKLQRLCGHTVAAAYEIDESLLGGFIVYIDDRIIDGSLRHRLKEVKEGIGR